nr:FGGY-family carbohydrate kinase [Candidatus Njordarchaeum guaymaensis]
MLDKLFVAYDVGTTNLKVGLLDTRFRILGKKSTKYPIYFPEKGYAEQDPLDWWRAAVEATDQLMEEKNVSASRIGGIVFSGQTLSTVLIGKDGEPLMRSMIWMDARAALQAKRIIGKGLVKIKGYNLRSLLRFLKITGGGPGLAGQDHISRILWVKENRPGIYKRTYKFLDSNGFMIFKATGKPVISRFDAHLTWMMDTRPGKQNWSRSILKRYKIDEDKLPEIKPSAEVAGGLTEHAARELNLPEGLPVIVGAGDVASVAVGSGAVREGEFFVYIGTSDFMGMHLRKRKTDISHYMGSICGAIPDLYLYTGEQETAGTCLDWVKDEVFREETAKLGEKVYDLLEKAAAKMPPGSKGLMYTPWLSGEKTPFDNDTIRGGFHNLSIEHTREHMVRAVMEGVALNMRWAFRCMEKKVGRNAEWVNFVGGGAVSTTWGQIIADALNRKTRQVENPKEAGVRGATMIATIALGINRNFSAAARG